MINLEQLPVSQLSTWDGLIANLPAAHILQTAEWAEAKAQYHWQPHPYLWREEGKVVAAALILERSVRAGLRVLYCPRGPLLDWQNSDLRATVLQGLQSIAHQPGVIFLKMDPELATGWGVPDEPSDRADLVGLQILTEWQQAGWISSPDQIQFRNSALLDLTGSEADWLARMKQKSRYNLRLAERRGVTIRLAGIAEMPLFYKMYAETSVRDGFVIRSEDYYQTVWKLFLQRGMADLLLAEVEGEVVSGIILFHFAGRAWYLYGMSREVHRDKMPNYLLQWEAMRRAKAAGCSLYDLWGAPDVFDESDSMWGVFRFKEGIGAQVIRTVGAWDYTARPLLYALYTRLLPRILNLMRQRGRARTQAQVQNTPL